MTVIKLKSLWNYMDIDVYTRSIVVSVEGKAKRVFYELNKDSVLFILHLSLAWMGWSCSPKPWTIQLSAFVPILHARLSLTIFPTVPIFFSTTIGKYICTTMYSFIWKKSFVSTFRLTMYNIDFFFCVASRFVLTTKTLFWSINQCTCTCIKQKTLKRKKSQFRLKSWPMSFWLKSNLIIRMAVWILIRLDQFWLTLYNKRAIVKILPENVQCFNFLFNVNNILKSDFVLCLTKTLMSMTMLMTNQ